jgi:transposase
MRFRCTSNREYLITTTLRAQGDPPTAHALPVRVRDWFAARTLTALAKGEWKIGTMMIQRDPLKRSTWYLRLAYTRLVDEVPITDRTVAIQRGIRNFLVASAWDGRTLQIEGADIVEYLRRIQARRRQLQRSIRGSGRRGHGRVRALAPIKVLEGRGERWRETKCLQCAAELVRFVESVGASRVFLADLAGVRTYATDNLGEHIGQMVQEWPYYRLQTAIQSALEGRGYHVDLIVAADHRRTCTACGHIDPANVDHKAWVLQCVQCGARRDLDVSAAIMLRRQGERLGAEPEAVKEKQGSAKGGLRRKGRRSQTSGNGAKSKGELPGQ